jgi:hypothetical protein
MFPDIGAEFFIARDFLSDCEQRAARAGDTTCGCGKDANEGIGVNICLHQPNSQPATSRSHGIRPAGPRRAYGAFLGGRVGRPPPHGHWFEEIFKPAQFSASTLVSGIPETIPVFCCTEFRTVASFSASHIAFARNARPCRQYHWRMFVELEWGQLCCTFKRTVAQFSASHIALERKPDLNWLR